MLDIITTNSNYIIHFTYTLLINKIMQIMHQRKQ